MPQCTGPELAQVIRMHDDWTHVPIVYVSGASGGADQLLATRKAGEAFVSKPVDPRELVATLRANGRHARQVAEAVSRDGLTGVLKRSFIHEYLRRRAGARAARWHLTSVAMIDIDHFQGRQRRARPPGRRPGDPHAGATLRQRLRGSDGLGAGRREEFLAVLPDCRAGRSGNCCWPRRCSAFREIRFASAAGEFSCTFSAGVAEARGGEGSDLQLVALADQALYTAKRAGRNRITRARTPAREGG
jgi:diguanylate cyclase (GGDEF)-like protein